MTAGHPACNVPSIDKWPTESACKDLVRDNDAFPAIDAPSGYGRYRTAAADSWRWRVCAATRRPKRRPTRRSTGPGSGPTAGPDRGRQPDLDVGQEAFTGPLQEDYAESPGGERLVQYFDKARMEITKPDAVDDGLWYVSNGLLVIELVTGRMQMGDASFVDLTPAEIPVAGDPTTRTARPTRPSRGC